MSRRTSISIAVQATLCGALPLAAAHADAATSCEALASLALPETQITLAERVPAGNFDPPGPPPAFGPPGPRTIEVPAMCRVAGTVAPAIRFEVWLPEGDTWNGRFQAVGGGGLAGVISYEAMGDAIRDGYATASTDTGHESTDDEWLKDRQRVIDYGYRAIHEMTVKAKAIIDAHYGGGPQYSYFNGCSTGGRQGLMEAQRYPGDYDGIVAGAPVFDFTHLHIAQLWTAHATLNHPGAVLDSDDFELVQNAVLEMCDANDGVEDGFLADPRRCDFDPAVLQCDGAGAGDQCLAPEQVRALEMIYAGPVNPRTGVAIYPGLMPGGEGAQPGNPGWGMIMDGEDAFFMDTALLNGMTFRNDDYDWRTFDFDRDMALVNAKLAHVLNAVNPDLGAFRANGGKLILYHGWNDPGVMPERTIDYYDAMIEFADKAGEDGADVVAGFARLYMMPGMGHCRGGAGPDQVDFMGALVNWVENGEAPGTLLSRRESREGPTMTRPACAYPEVARYQSGDPNDAGNFICEAP